MDGYGRGRRGCGGRVGRARSRVCKSSYMDSDRKKAPTQPDCNRLQPDFRLQSVGLSKGCGCIACLMPKATSKDRSGPVATGCQRSCFFFVLGITVYCRAPAKGQWYATLYVNLLPPTRGIYLACLTPQQGWTVPRASPALRCA